MRDELLAAQNREAEKNEEILRELRQLRQTQDEDRATFAEFARRADEQDNRSVQSEEKAPVEGDLVTPAGLTGEASNLSNREEKPDSSTFVPDKTNRMKRTYGLRENPQKKRK